MVFYSGVSWMPVLWPPYKLFAQAENSVSVRLTGAVPKCGKGEIAGDAL